MTELTFSQRKPSSNSIPSELYRLFVKRGFIILPVYCLVFFLSEDYVNWWGLTTILAIGLIIAIISVLGPILVVLNNRTERVQSLPVATVQISPQEIVCRDRFSTKTLRVKDINRVQVSRKWDGTISEIVLYRGLFNSLHLEKFEDMPGLHVALKENLPIAFPWSEAKPPQFNTLAFLTFYFGGGWLWGLLTGENFISAATVGGLAALGAYFA